MSEELITAEQTEIINLVRDKIGSLLNEDNKVKILVIDDSKMQRKFIIRKLEQLNVFKFFEAADGQESLDILRTESDIKTAFVDVEMPVMSGREFVPVALDENLLSNDQIVMVTSVDDQDTVFNFYSLGVSSYVVKPVDELELLKKLHEVLRDVL